MSISGTHGNVVVNGFTAVPLKLKQNDQAEHHLFLKQHRVKDTDASKPEDKTLFVINIPPYCTKESLKQIFSKSGRICHVYLHERPTSAASEETMSKYFPNNRDPQGFKVAYIVFKNAHAVSKAVELPFDEVFLIETENSHLNTGIAEWCQQYEDSIVDIDRMQKEINIFMIEFDKKIEEDKQKAKDTEGVPDEEGWITVSRHSNKVVPRTEANEKKFKTKERKKRKEKELLHFYSFQVQQTKQQQIDTLRQKFEEDKQRIALMKASRKFRPY